MYKVTSTRIYTDQGNEIALLKSGESIALTGDSVEDSFLSDKARAEETDFLPAVLLEEKYRREKEVALDLAQQVFSKTLDRSGRPYMAHLGFVADRTKTHIGEIIAWLHTIFDYTDGTMELLVRRGVSPDIVRYIDAIHKKDDEPFSDYMSRIKGSYYLMDAKVADYQHDLERLKTARENGFEVSEQIEDYEALINSMIEEMNSLVVSDD